MIVSVGVMVGRGCSDRFAEVGVVDGDGVSEGVWVGVMVRVGVGDEVSVATLGAAAGIVGKAVQVGVGLTTEGEILATGGGVGLTAQAVRALTTMIRSSKAVRAGLLRARRRA